eukprot:symbB.v1.2.017726.t2/scaffold1366.1/size123243/2
MLLLAWNSLAGTGRSFTAALTSNIFSGAQVFAIMAVMACMILDRALYTWYTQDRVAAEGSSGPEDDLRSSMAAGLQLLLLLAQLVTLHVVQVNAWAESANPTVGEVSMFDSFMLVIFYVFYVLYLVFSSMQLRYDVHLLRGGLGLTHSVDFVPWLLFKVYTVVPFVEELRVLTDWTVTSTSMNLFMWFKLEDAQQGLYKTKCDMNARKYVQPAHERPVREKLLQGGLFLLALFVLIVGPITYFSTANLFLKNNLVYTGSLKASLEVEMTGGGISQLPLYDTAQADISTESGDAARRFAASNPGVVNTADLNLQRVAFPMSADNLWLVSNSLRQKVATQLGTNGTKANLVVTYAFQGNLTTAGRGVGRTPPIALNEEQVYTLAKVLQNTSFQGEASIEVPCSLKTGIQTRILIDSSGQLTPIRPFSSLRLTLSSSSPLPQWSMAQSCEPCSSSQSEEGKDTFCGITFDVASEKVAPTPAGDSSSSSYSLMGIYLGVVYTIGRFLRLVFQDSSQRVIYEEMNDTESLQDLCSGIYIARITGDLKSEYAFYYQLIRIFRSPELLLDISKPKSKMAPWCFGQQKNFAPAAAMALHCRHTFLHVEELSSVHCKVRSSSLPPERGHQRSFRSSCSDPYVDGLLERAGANYKWPEELGKCSKGSLGHPEVCGRFCIRFFYGNCHKGENCEFCHLEHKESKLKLDKVQRQVLEQLSQSEVLTLVLPHIEKRCTKHRLKLDLKTMAILRLCPFWDG